MNPKLLYTVVVFVVFQLLLHMGKLEAQVSAQVFDKAMATGDMMARRQITKAVDLLELFNYQKAADCMEVISNPDIYAQYIKGVCYSHMPDKKTEALPLIQALSSKQVDGYHTSIAQAFWINNKIEEALWHYKQALLLDASQEDEDKEFRNELNTRVKNCENILKARKQINSVRISPLGSPLNTDGAEYCPLISSNDQVLIYTYRGPKSTGGKQKTKSGKGSKTDDLELYFEDVFCSVKINDTTWSEPVGPKSINTNLHDASVALNAEGTELFVYRNTGAGSGDLYLSRLEGETWTQPEFQENLNSREWEGSACFIPNSNRIIFSSERKGGFGGKDLYYAERSFDSHWKNITNLGSEINSEKDEDSPFVTSDGNILFFSSNNSNSLGGYDIFRSDLKSNTWSAPYNLGMPINTIYDDKYFTVRADGKVAYFSSGTDDANQDLYKVEPGVPGKPVALLQVQGLVTVAGKASGAEIEVRSGLDSQAVFYTRSNGVSGKFLTNLPSGNEYELTIKLISGLEKKVKLNTVAIDSFVVLNVFVDFELDHPINDSSLIAVSEREKGIPFEGNLDVFLSDKQSKDLVFKIQVGASRFSDSFNYSKLIGFPKIFREENEAGIFKYLMGEYTVYSEARALLLKVQQACCPDAFIVPYFKGQRRTFGEL